MAAQAIPPLRAIMLPVTSGATFCRKILSLTFCRSLSITQRKRKPSNRLTALSKMSKRKKSSSPVIISWMSSVNLSPMSNKMEQEKIILFSTVQVQASPTASPGPLTASPVCTMQKTPPFTVPLLSLLTAKSLMPSCRQLLKVLSTKKVWSN